MTETISRTRTTWILITISGLCLLVAVLGYSYLISSNCEASSAGEFLSAFRAFHTEAGC